MKPIARDILEDLSAWVVQSDSPTPPDAVSQRVDDWLSTQHSADVCPFGKTLAMGCLILFESLPSMAEIDPGEIDWFLAGYSSDERRDAIYAGAALTPSEQAQVLCSWIGGHFEDPDQGGVTGYCVDRFGPEDGGDVVVVTYWYGEYFQEGSLAAAFRSPDEATTWLGSQGILDEQWISDEQGALAAAVREHVARGGSRGTGAN